MVTGRSVSVRWRKSANGEQLRERKHSCPTSTSSRRKNLRRKCDEGSPTPAAFSPYLQAALDAPTAINVTVQRQRYRRRRACLRLQPCARRARAGGGVPPGAGNRNWPKPLCQKFPISGSVTSPERGVPLFVKLTWR